MCNTGDENGNTPYLPRLMSPRDSLAPEFPVGYRREEDHTSIWEHR